MPHEAIDRAIAAEVVKDARNGTAKNTPTPPSRLEPTSLAYWHKVNEGLKLAQEQMNRAVALEAEAQTLRASVTALQGAYESFFQHLSETHAFELQTTRISPEGVITRADSAVGQ
jgi:hypothetical protein